MARGFYYDGHRSVPASKQRLAAQNLKWQGYIEPPVMEAVTAGVYRITHREPPWFPRLLSAIAWVAAGGVLLLIARRLMCPAGAWIAAGIFLFLPFGVRAGVAFQPDPLMVLCTLIAVLAIVRYREMPSAGRLWVASGLSGLAIVVKPGIPAFLLLAIFAALAFDTARGRAPARHFLIFGLLAVVPSIGYFVYGTWIETFLDGQTDQKVIPGLWVDPDYWTGWARQILRILTPALIVLAAIGVLVADPPARRLLVAGWLGYLAFGLVFTYHVSTHDYYSLFLVPLAALSAGVAIPRLVQAAVRRWGDAGRVAVAASVAIAVVPALWEAWHWSRLRPTQSQATLRHIGARVSHSGRVLVLDGNYGLPLQYEGWVGGDYWPSTGDLDYERVRGHRAAADRREFARTLTRFDWFVVLDEAEWSRQPSIREHAERRLTLVEQGSNFRIYRVTGPHRRSDRLRT